MSPRKSEEGIENILRQLEREREADKEETERLRKKIEEEKAKREKAERELESKTLCTPEFPAVSSSYLFPNPSKSAYSPENRPEHKANDGDILKRYKMVSDIFMESLTKAIHYNNECKPLDAEREIKFAISLLPEGLENNPEYKHTFAVAYLILGSAYLSQKRLDKAEEAYSQSIQHNPTYADPYSSLGLVAMERKDEAEAKKWFKKALEIDPNVDISHNGRVLLNKD